MKKTFLFLALAAFAFACSDAGDSGGSETTAAAPAADGAKIYKTYCVQCHGIQGNMGGSGAFDLTTSALSVDQRVEVITNGRNTMPPHTMLSPEKIKAVAEYSMTLKK